MIFTAFELGRNFPTPTTLYFQKDLVATALAAYTEIGTLKEKLNCQSTMLAEALKLKNDNQLAKCNALTERNEYKRLYNHVDWQAIGKELGLPVGTHVVEEILPKLRDLNYINHNLRLLLDVKTKELDARLAELEKLRPPEPRFRVGQVVRITDVGFYFRQIMALRRGEWHGQPSWLYTTQTGSEHGESVLRALTDEEK